MCSIGAAAPWNIGPHLSERQTDDHFLLPCNPPDLLCNILRRGNPTCSPAFSHNTSTTTRAKDLTSIGCVVSCRSPAGHERQNTWRSEVGSLARVIVDIFPLRTTSIFADVSEICFRKCLRCFTQMAATVMAISIEVEGLLQKLPIAFRRSVPWYVRTCVWAIGWASDRS